MDVTYGDNPQYPAPSGYFPIPGYTYLTLVFDSLDGASLISVAMGKDFEGILKVSVPGGFKMAYVTDQAGQKYHAVEIGQAHLIIPVPEGSTGFTLHLAELTPVEIGE